MLTRRVPNHVPTIDPEQRDNARTLGLIVRAAYGMHWADQLALICVPLIAELVFDASPATIGVLVACQSMAQLFGSIPFGLLVDRSRPRALAVAATGVSIIGFLGAWLGVTAQRITVFGGSIVLAGFGIVLFVLTVLSILPTITRGGDLTAANSRVELPRSLASFVVPLLVGLVLTAGNANWFMVAAVTGAATAALFSMRLPSLAPPAIGGPPVVQQLRDGVRYVRDEPRLRAITWCALAWNTAFAIVLVALLPFLELRQLDAGLFGLAFAAFGLAAVFGSRLAGLLSDRIAPRTILIFGPASSVVAIVLVLVAGFAGSPAGVLAGFFLLGFGPSMWVVAQNSVRQLVTPLATLGRVNAVIQTAIYGVRPLGALLGGVIVSQTSPTTGLIVAAAAFIASTYATVASALRHIIDYRSLATVS
jgi:predicted MFS family arabinose efflux permease